MLKKLPGIVHIFCVFIFIGCVEHVALTEEKKASIKSVYINEEVAIQYIGPFGFDAKLSDFNQLNQKTLADLSIGKYLVPLPRSCPLPRRGSFWPLTDFGKFPLPPGTDPASVRIRARPVELHPNILYVECERGGQIYTYNFQDAVLGVIFSGNTIWMVKADNDAQITRYWTETPEPLNANSMMRFILKKNNIDIGQIWRDKFSDALQNSQLFNITTSESADAEFKFNIQAISLLMWAYKWKPVLGVTATLSKRDDEILWQKYGELSHLDKRTNAHKAPGVEYINNPKLLKEIAEEASKIVAEDLVNDLKK
jgi:hypothetical protein